MLWQVTPMYVLVWVQRLWTKIKSDFFFSGDFNFNIFSFRDKTTKDNDIYYFLIFYLYFYNNITNKFPHWELNANKGYCQS